jgi:DnaD/phage-associated family protein
MQEFEGFPGGKVDLVPLPATIFMELLPEIDHLGELKVTLYVFFRLSLLEGPFPYIRADDLLADKRFMDGLGATTREAQANLDLGLERAIRRGTLLRASLPSEDKPQILYFINSPRGRAAINAIENGEWRPTGDSQRPVEVVAQPNIYRLYEENIGPLTPLIADVLREAEATYPLQWIEDAIRISVENNVRNWRYTAAILERWQIEGRDERKDRQDTQKARRRYVEGEYSDYIEH